MALSFQPKSEDEIKTASLAPDSEYDFEVLQAEEAVSKKTGAPMIKVKLGVYHGDTMRWHIYDYLIASFESKLRHFCDAVGLLAKYESGTLCAADCQGRGGRAKIVIREDREGKYPPKNEIKDYCLRPAKPIAQPSRKDEAPPAEGDDVPF